MAQLWSFVLNIFFFCGNVFIITEFQYNLLEKNLHLKM